MRQQIAMPGAIRHGVTILDRVAPVVASADVILDRSTRR